MEELSGDGILMIKWKLSVASEDEEKLKNYISHIQISVSYEQETLLREEIKTSKGKISFTSKNRGFSGFKICVTYHGGWHMPFPIFVGLKFGSDHMDEPDISTAIKTEHLQDMQSKAKNIVESAKELISRQKGDSEDEDILASTLMRNSRSYYNIAVFQILVVLALGIYQVFNFRKFLLTNEVI
jgi:hypothetical protein